MRTGLVLGGGGVTGIAWEVGLLKGLRDEGVDVTGADLVVGTSAGSVVGALVTTEHIDDLYAEQTSPPEAEIPAVFSLRTALTIGALMALPGDGRSRRARVGRAARKANPGPGAERVAVFEARLRRADGSLATWPDRDLKVTAVDAETGAFQVFDRHGDVDLLHAVAASCAVPLVWPAVEIGGRSFIDGGMRSPANADLATGCEVVLAVVPLPQTVTKRHSMPEQLRRTGARWTAWISPDKQSLEAIGRNVLDPAMRVGAARAGAAQGRRMAAEVGEHWPIRQRRS
jgi:NTE family protein